MTIRALDIAICLAGICLMDNLAYAQRTEGPGQTVERVPALSIDTYFIEFGAMQTAEVAIVGDGDTDLDLYIFDEKGQLVAKDIGVTDVGYCTWKPRRRGTYRVEVRNLGTVYNEYVILTN